MAESTYYIWSNEHRAWWGPGRCGYTPDITKAGHCTREQAIEICRDAIPSSMDIGMPAEIPVASDDMVEMMRGQVFPGGFFGR